MEQFSSGKFINLRNLLYILPPVCISLYLIYPLLKGDYLYPIAEYELYKSFMINFIDTLKRGELPVWNEYVGSGHPALYFGHYPITQNTIFYMLFGFNDFTYYFTKFIGLVILLLSFIYACKYLRMTYLIALAGALAYFSINFVIRVLPAETIGNLLFVYPLLVIFIIKIIDENKKKDIIVFSLFYIFWLTGGHIIYVYMHLMMLSIVYLITIFVFNGYVAFKAERLKRFISLYFIMFIAPFSAVLYQYYFIYDVVSASNRLKEGFIASPFDPIVWTQLMASFQSSSYFLIGLSLSLLYAIQRLMAIRYKFVNINFVISNWILLLIAVLLSLTVINVQFASKNNIISDLIPILNSNVFRIALLLYIAVHFILNKMRYFFSYLNLNDIVIPIVYIFLLSYYFYSPENIIGDVNGYDFDLFRELSAPLQILFTLSILFSVKYYTSNKAVKIAVLSLIALYFIRSHLTIPLMRFTGVIWYAPRDGSIFSVFFAVLFMFGLKEMFSKLSCFLKERDKKLVKYIQYALLFLILLLFVRDSFDKLYKGTSHRFIYPNKMEIAKTGTENWILNAREASALLNNKLLELDKEAKHFYRVFTPENNYIYLAGNMQHNKIHEAVIYESSISRELQDLYDYTILEKNPSLSKDLKAVMPYFLFTRHVHSGLNLQYRDIQYRDFFMFSPKDAAYLNNQNIEFLWDIMQVKYLIIAPEFSKALEDFTTNKHYKLIGSYPKVNLNLYEIVKDKSFSRLAVLPLVDKQDYVKAIEQLNSKDINILKWIYSKLVFLDNNTDFILLKSENSSTTRYYEIESSRKAILIDFESWNHNWKLEINNKNEQPQKAFQMFRGIKIAPGINQIRLSYHVKYFKEMFWIGISVTLIYIVLLFRYHYAKR